MSVVIVALIFVVKHLIAAVDGPAWHILQQPSLTALKMKALARAARGG